MTTTKPKHFIIISAMDILPGGLLRSSNWFALQERCLLEADEELRKVLMMASEVDQSQPHDAAVGEMGGGNNEDYPQNVNNEHTVDDSICENDEDTVSRQSSIEDDLSLNSAMESLGLDDSVMCENSSIDSDDSVSEGSSSALDLEHKKYQCHILVRLIIHNNSDHYVLLLCSLWC